MASTEHCKRDVIFVVLPQVVLLDLAGPADAFRNANMRVPDSYRLRFVSSTPDVESAVGLGLAGLEPLPAELPEESIVVLCGIGGHSIPLESPEVTAIKEWLASGVASKATLICV